MTILFRYVTRQYLLSFLSIFTAILAIFLVVDFIDRAKGYVGSEGWVLAVLELYGYKSLTVAHQLAPAALLLAGGTAASVFRKRGELTAIHALTFGPAALYLPVALCAGVISVGLVAFDEHVVGPASRKVDQLTYERFSGRIDWRALYAPKQWFRSGNYILNLRAGNPETGFDNVTLIELSPEFRLVARADAQRMEFVEGTRWRLLQGSERRFHDDGSSSIREFTQRDVALEVDRSAFRIRSGRPEQLRRAELREQIDVRNRVGLATAAFELALHNRFAYPIAGLPAALLAVGLAMRASRKGHLTTALVEGLAVAMSMWGMMVVAKTLVTAQRLSPLPAAWLPVVLLSAAALVLVLSNHGWLPRVRPREGKRGTA